METSTYTPAQIKRFERLAAKLAQLPMERAEEIDERAAIFVTGLESGIRLAQSEQRPATEAIAQ